MSKKRGHFTAQQNAEIIDNRYHGPNPTAERNGLGPTVSAVHNEPQQFVERPRCVARCAAVVVTEPPTFLATVGRFDGDPLERQVGIVVSG